MLLSTLDTALRAGTATLLLLLAALFYRDFRHTVAGRLGIAFALGSAAHAVSSAAGFATPVTASTVSWRVPLIALSTGNVVVFWLFARALFDDAFRPRWWQAAAWAAVAGVSLANCLLFSPAPDAATSGIGFNAIVMTLIALAFIALALRESVASWSADLVESRRRLRVFIVVAAAVYGAANAVLQLMMSGTASSALVNTANAALLAGVVAAISWSLMRVGGHELFSPAPRVGPDGSAAPALAPATAADRKLIDALNRLMAQDRVYRDERLTIGTLALRLGVPEYRLRRLINQRLGYRNFNAFLNDHRIQDVRTALSDPTQAEVPVITIAMDAGFQSLGPFNRAFKSITGVTPSEYRRRNGTPAPSPKSLRSEGKFEIG